MPDERTVYVGRKACGCIVSAVNADPKYAKWVAQDVAQMIRHGYQVERIPGPALVMGCQCAPLEPAVPAEARLVVPRGGAWSQPFAELFWRGGPASGTRVHRQTAASLLNQQWVEPVPGQDAHARRQVYRLSAAGRMAVES